MQHISLQGLTDTPGSGGPQLSLGWWSRHKREMIVLPGDTGLPAGLARAQPASRNHRTQLHQLFQQVVDYLMEPRAISCLRKQPLVLTAFILIKMCTARTSRPPSFAWSRLIHTRTCTRGGFLAEALMCGCGGKSHVWPRRPSGTTNQTFH